MKTPRIALGISLLLLSYGCDQKGGLTVQAIDTTFNQRYMTGNGLDSNLFSRKEVVQYYQVANFGGLQDHQLLAKLDSVAMANVLPDRLKSVTFLFYKKKAFVDYRDNLFESARETENGHLIGHNEDLLASIIVERMKENSQKMSIRRLLYEKNKLKLKETVNITR